MFVGALDNAKRDLAEALMVDAVWPTIIRIGVAERNLHRPVSPIGFDQWANLADHIAHDIVQDEQTAREQAREAAADGEPTG